MSEKFYRTSTHPHGKLVTNLSKTLAFVRISKCASSTISHRHNLYYWSNFSEHKNTYLTFCAIREPRARFLSSIPETLCRIFNIESEDTKHHFANVGVSGEVFTFLSKQIEKSDCFISSFIKTIEEYGFFDAHHEPMVRFLINEKNQIEINPITIKVDEIDILSEFIYSFSGIESNKNLPNVNINQSNSQRINSFYKEFFKKIPSRTKHILKDPLHIPRSKYHVHKTYRQIRNLDKHPLLVLIKSPISSFRNKYSWPLMKSLIYDNLKNTAKEFALDGFLRKYYDDDIRIFSKLSDINKKLTPQNLLSSTKRFEDLIS